MILNVAHQKGGVGKSTLAIQIALVLSADILDLDSQHSCALFSQLRQTNGHKPLTVHVADTVDELKEVLKPYQDSKQLIVIDSGGYDSAINSLSLALSEVIITPVGPSQIELFGLQRFQRILERISDQFGGTIRTNVLINNADPRSQGAIGELQKFIEHHPKHFDLMKSVVHSRADFKRSYGAGVSVLEGNKNSKAALEIELLTKEITALLSV